MREPGGRRKKCLFSPNSTPVNKDRIGTGDKEASEPRPGV
jgi:hypothetical protein